MPIAAIHLREIERADLGTINQWRNDADLVASLGSGFRHTGLAVDEQWFDRYLAARANNVRLAICQADETMVGAIYLLDIDWLHRHAEFAIWLGDASARGQGVGEQASRMALSHAFDDLNLERIYLNVLAGNEPATQLYRKLGFVEEGRQRRSVFKGGVYHDVVLMAILRDEHRPS
jgi:diamine N-acetyltransferase